MNYFDDKIQSIEQRLSRIEQKLNITSDIDTAPKQPEPATIKQRADQPSNYGKWLGVTAVICFVLAAGFIIKLSIDSGWLTPARQIVIATLFGFSLIALGFRYIKLDREYASFLPATGIIILYLSGFAAYSLYSLISFETALVLSSIISLYCIYIYSIVKHDIYPIIACCGAYLAPLILNINLLTILIYSLPYTNVYWPLYYYLVCSLTFAVLSIWMSSRLLTIISSYLAILITGTIGMNLHDNHFIAGLLALHFIIFAMATYAYTWLKQNLLTETESWCFFPILILFYAFEYSFLNDTSNYMAAWFSLGFAALLIALYLITKQILAKENFVSESMLFTFVAIVAFHSGYLVLMPESAGPWLFVFSVSAFALLTDYFAKHTKNIFPLPVKLIFLLVLLIEYVKIANQLFSPPVNDSWIVIFLAAASIWMLFICQNKRFENNSSYGYILLSFAHLIVLLALYRLTTDIGSLAVSSAWLAYAIAILIFGFVRKDAIMANSALLVLGFSAGKVLLYDAASAPTTIRILCLLLTGTVLYGAGFLYRKISVWKV